MKSFYQSCYSSISRKRAMVLKLALCVLLVLFYSVPSVSAQEPMQEVVYLKNGSVIHGQIIEQVPNVSIKIQTRDGNIFVYNMEDIMKIVKEPSPFPEKAVKEERSPGLAFVLSFLVPGLGQHYNGEHAKGIVQEVLVAGGIVLMIVGWEEVYYDYYYYTYDYEATAWFWIGFGIASGASLWSMIDAPLSASKINRERSRQRWGHLIEFDNDKYALGLDVAPKKQGMEAKLTLHF